MCQLWSSSSAEIRRVTVFTTIGYNTSSMILMPACRRAEPEHSSSWILAVWSPTWAVLPLLWDVLVGCEACLDCLCPTESPVISWGSSPQALGWVLVNVPVFTRGPGAQCHNSHDLFRGFILFFFSWCSSLNSSCVVTTCCTPVHLPRSPDLLSPQPFLLLFLCAECC